MNSILQKLSGGDRRSIGKADQVVQEILVDDTLFAQLVEGLTNDNEVIRMRTADAMEKITVERPDLLQPYKQLLIRRVGTSKQIEVRWHFAQMCTRLSLSQVERDKVMEMLVLYLDDMSSIVKTCAMQAMTELALQDRKLRPVVSARLSKLTSEGTAAMRSRGKRLLKLLACQD